MYESDSKILTGKSLFIIPLSGCDKYLLYAPLADSILLLDKSECERIVVAVSSPKNADEEALSIVDALCDVTPVESRDEQIKDERDFINLSILPNNICNFSCSYCYSAKGRSTQQLSVEKAYSAVDYFISPDRNVSKLLTVSIFGGGEPLLSWKNVVKPLIDYVYVQAERLSRNVVTTLITNGSMIPEGFLEICRKYSVDLVCSFEILEDVQNHQRKHYDVVSSNIRKMIDEGVVPAVNSVITEVNVNRQCEMIEELHNRYPEIKYVAFEPVIDATIVDKDKFYHQFTKDFFKAVRLAEVYDIKLTCSALRNVDVTVDRYCPGEFALCADGSLSVCPCVSSPLEPNYSRYVYGQVDSSGVKINREKLKALLSQNLHSQSWCNDCFAKWNCGGGCTNNTINNGGKEDSSYCKFVRRFLKYTLLKRLESIYQEEYDINLREIIGDYERFITE